MKHRKEVPLSEVLAAIDARVASVKSKQAFLRKKRVKPGHIEHNAWSRKTRELAIERFCFELIRHDMSLLRSGPRPIVSAADLLRTA